MCTIIDRKQEVTILEEDLIVYKRYKLIPGYPDRVQSPLMGNINRRNILLKTDIKEVNKGIDICYFDSIESKKVLSIYPNFYEICKKYFKYLLNKEELEEIPFKAIAHGFHSALNKRRLSNICYGEVFKCIIPKGSEVYYGYANLIVSNQLIIKEQIS